MNSAHAALIADVIKIIAALVTLFSGVLPLALRKPTPPPALPLGKPRRKRRRPRPDSPASA